jgi:hypothetical protein
MSEEGDQHEDFLDFTAWLAERTGDSGDVTWLIWFNTFCFENLSNPFQVTMLYKTNTT